MESSWGEPRHAYLGMAAALGVLGLTALIAGPVAGLQLSHDALVPQIAAGPTPGGASASLTRTF